MHASQSHYDSSTAIRTDLGAIFVSLELSRATWLVTSLSPGNGEKMSKHAVQGGDVGELLSRFAHLQEKARCVLAMFFQSLRSRRRGSMGSGSTEFCRSTASKVILSTQHQLRRHVVAGEPRPTRLTARRWCVRC